MKIGIIGSGNIGATLARKLKSAGHRIYLANSRGADSLKDFAAETGVIASSPEAAVAGAEVVIISVPFGKIPDLKPLLSQLPPTVIIADTSNYFPHREGVIDPIEAGQTESLWVSEQLGRSVVKAWNTVLAGSLVNSGQPEGTSNRIALPVAGDDKTAVDTVSALINETGFDAIASGSLQDSWRQQPGNPDYCTDLTSSELRKALSEADRKKAPRRRDHILEELAAYVGEESFDQTSESNQAYLLKLNREVSSKV